MEGAEARLWNLDGGEAVDECEGLRGWVCGCVGGVDVFVEEEGGLMFGVQKSDFSSMAFFLHSLKRMVVLL